MALQTYRELEAWKKAMDFVAEVYRLCADLPGEEKYGLASQVKRAAVSIPANIAEGYGRTHRGDYLHHLSIARGSLAEAETLLLIAVRLEYVTRKQAADVWKSSQETWRILNKLIASLKQRPRPSNPEPRTLNPEP